MTPYDDIAATATAHHNPRGPVAVAVPATEAVPSDAVRRAAGGATTRQALPRYSSVTPEPSGLMRRTTRLTPLAERSVAELPPDWHGLATPAVINSRR